MLRPPFVEIYVYSDDPNRRKLFTEENWEQFLDWLGTAGDWDGVLPNGDSASVFLGHKTILEECQATGDVRMGLVSSIRDIIEHVAKFYGREQRDGVD